MAVLFSESLDGLAEQAQCLLRNGDLVYIDVESYGQHGLTYICINGINLDIAEQRVDLHRRRVVRLSVNIRI